MSNRKLSGTVLLLSFFLPSAPFPAAAEVPANAVIAHRGASAYAPEHSRPAFEIARELGADYLEIDLQISKDGELVVFHDDELLEKTNARQKFPGRKSYKVSDFTLAELKQLDTGSWFVDKHPGLRRQGYAGQPMLTLDEVITIAEGGKGKRPGLYIETKNPEQGTEGGRSNPRMELLLKALLEKRGWNRPDGRVIFQTFDKESLERLNRLFPEHPKVLLLWLGKGYMERPEDYEDFLRFARLHGASGVGPDHEKLLEAEHIRLLRKYGMMVHPYTVNDRGRMVELGDRLATIRHRGLFTDRADVALEVAGRPHRSVHEIAESLGYPLPGSPDSHGETEAPDAGPAL